MSPARILLILPLALVTCLIFSACGDSGASQEELDRARQQGIAKERQKQRLDELERELKGLKGSKGKPPPSAPSGATATSGTTSCGASLSVGANTTCEFAANVEADYYAEIRSGPGTVSSYSPARDTYITMYCSAGSPHVCTGGDEASVYFP